MRRPARLKSSGVTSELRSAAGRELTAQVRLAIQTATGLGTMRPKVIKRRKTNSCFALAAHAESRGTAESWTVSQSAIYIVPTTGVADQHTNQ